MGPQQEDDIESEPGADGDQVVGLAARGALDRRGLTGEEGDAVRQGPGQEAPEEQQVRQVAIGGQVSQSPDDHRGQHGVDDRGLDAARQISGQEQGKDRQHEQEAEVAGPDGWGIERYGCDPGEAIAPDDQGEAHQGDHSGHALPGGLAQTRHHAPAPGGGEEAQGVHAEEETEAKDEDSHAGGLRWGYLGLGRGDQGGKSLLAVRAWAWDNTTGSQPPLSPPLSTLTSRSLPLDTLIEAHDLVRTYPGVRAVDGVSFAVAPGRCFGLLGPNGAGKTTTLEMLEGIQTPTSGEVRYRSEPLDAAYREAVGIQFQATALQDFQTVAESLDMFAALYRRTADREELVRLCNLGEILDRDTRKLSGGQRQRLLLAIALVNEPELVFLDEPTTGLDPQARRNFWGLIETVRARGTTVLLTTHYMEEAERLCDEIAIVDRGRIIAQGNPAQLVREHFPATVIRLPAAGWPAQAPLPAGAMSRNGEIELFAEAVPPVLKELEAVGADLGSLRVTTPNLEDLFIKLTGHDLRT